MERGEYRPNGEQFAEGSASDQAFTLGNPVDLAGQQADISRQLAAVEKQPEYWLRLDYHLLHLQRRVLDYRAHWQTEAIPSEETSNLLARAKYDLQVFDTDGSL